jgi:transcriptional regulator with XRE-family HTH domain
MHTAQAKSFYSSGFPKEMQRGKYNLPLNERLKAARNAKELSAAQVVKKLKRRGVSIGHSTLQGYEANESSINHRYPSLPVLLVLSEFYECSLDYLFGYTQEPNRYDMRKQLENNKKVFWDGKKLKKKHREELLAEMDYIVSNQV